MYIPIILLIHRIMGMNRIEPCHCGHYHVGKEVILPEVTPIAYMDMLVAQSMYESMDKTDSDMQLAIEFMGEKCQN